MSVLVITTGGTIGALPYEDPKNPPEFSSMPPKGHDLVRDAMSAAFASIKSRCVSLEPRDSKLIDDAYRLSVLEIIGNAPESLVLVTHGTDTILKTADFFHQNLSSNPALQGKTIVLTGAMTPLSNGIESDGHMNLAFSLQQLTAFSPSLEKTNVVLCNFNESGAWQPRLYPYRPDKYEKFYDADGRYNRIIESQKAAVT